MAFDILIPEDMYVKLLCEKVYYLTLIGLFYKDYHGTKMDNNYNLANCFNVRKWFHNQNEFMHWNDLSRVKLIKGTQISVMNNWTNCEWPK